jgi:hypothetical protein
MRRYHTDLIDATFEPLFEADDGNGRLCPSVPVSPEPEGWSLVNFQFVEAHNFIGWIFVWESLL